MDESNDNIAVRGCSELIVGMALALLACFVISLCSCRPQKEMQIERVEIPVVVTQEHTTESVKIDHIRDTLFQRDSVYYYIKGDTTIIERWHYQQGVTNIYKVDTLHVFDSVPYPVETTREKINTKIEEVEKPFKWWQKALMWVGGFCIIGACCIVLFSVRKMAKPS